jgi:amino acid adenylation domain-containing protein
VGVCVERSVSAVVAMLGVLSAGAAFVPLDPEYPSERLRTMADDAGVRALLVGNAVRTRLEPAAGVVCLNLDDDIDADAAPPGRELRALPIEPGQLAYLIYTSGSTGKPKGVAVSHGALAAHCAAALVSYGLGEHDVGLEFAPFSFDAALEQWLLPLLAGGRLVVRGAEIWTPEEAHRVLDQERITWLQLPPSYCAELAHWAQRNDKTLPLRVCSLGGEGLPREGLRAIRALAPEATVVNAYGPAEAVITPLVWHDDGKEPATAYAPLGRPLAARTIHVLDTNLEPAPIGVIGELYIEGGTLARGYHAQPALTAARFLPAAHGARLYRTGDLGRFLADGTLEFVGRRDHQIKLRGFRIELGEIESALLTHADVSEAAVLLVEGAGAPRLVAYVAADNEHLADALRARLKAALPRHMLPSHVVVLGALPRTPNGKVDRKALLAIEAPRRTYVAARNEDERVLAVLFADLLQSAQPIGSSDDFFACGGDSLLALRLVARIKDELGVELPVRTVFEAPELAALAERIAEARTGVAAEQGIRDAIAQVENLNEDALCALLREAESTVADHGHE